MSQMHHKRPIKLARALTGSFFFAIILPRMRQMFVRWTNEETMKKHRGLLLTTASLLLVALGSYFVGLQISDGTPGSEAQVPTEDYGEQTRKAYAEAVATAEAERAKPVFRGILGDFQIVADYAPTDPSNLCGQGNRPSRESNFASSELNQARMTLQKVCADGRVVATWSDAGSYRYFHGKVVLQLDSPRENLQLIEIDGHNALIARPLGGIGTHEIFVIKRAPSEGEPGIMIWTWGESRSEAMAAAQREMEK